MKFDIKVIGHVANDVTERGHIEAQDLTSQIVIDPSYSSALDGIEPFSHVVVVFWLDRTTEEERKTLKVHPRGDAAIPLTGVFATRSPLRPNPIAITTVKLVERQGNILTVKGLDALNGTPVLDIKPYLPEPFLPNEVKVPDWIKRKHQGST